jgi:predicted transglutaminase-like cysteine proteinase
MRFHSGLLAVAALSICAPTPAFAVSPASSQAIQRQSPIIITPTGPNILGTIAQPIRAGRFSASTSHAFADASGSPLMQRLIAPARAVGRYQQMSYIQSRVNNNIRWVSDATEWGQHDYWATAIETLTHGAGDQEDRAIVKMQALKALGFSTSDLFLTLARDRVSGAIAVLVVRLGGRYYVLDDTGGPPYPASSRSFEFQPVISFGWSGAWVHTRPPVPPRVAAAATGSVAHK